MGMDNYNENQYNEIKWGIVRLTRKSGVINRLHRVINRKKSPVLIYYLQNRRECARKFPNYSIKWRVFPRRAGKLSTVCTRLSTDCAKLVGLCKDEKSENKFRLGFLLYYYTISNQREIQRRTTAVVRRMQSFCEAKHRFFSLFSFHLTLEVLVCIWQENMMWR